MNLDRATFHPEIAIKAEAEAARCRALSRASPESVQHLDEQGILDLQRVLRSGEQYGIWSTPKKYSPIAARATMNIDLRQRIAHFLPEHHKNMVRLADEMKSQIKNGAEAKQMPPQTSASIVRQILDGAVLGLMRYLILLRMVPAGIGRKGLGKVLDPTNVKAIGYTYMPVMFAIGVSKRLEINSFERDAGSNLENGDSRAPGYLSLIQSEDFEERVSASAKPYVLNECERMLMFADMGYWSDLPVIDEALKRVTHVAGSESPRRRQKISDPHLPLPDDYVAEMGRRSLWFINRLLKKQVLEA